MAQVSSYWAWALSVMAGICPDVDSTVATNRARCSSLRKLLVMLAMRAAKACLNSAGSVQPSASSALTLMSGSIIS